MLNNSVFFENAREEANVAFDEHCKQWDLLKEIPEPSVNDLAAWLSARDAFFKAQDKFENIVRQLSSSAVD
jgi:hypothetical protein